MVDSTPTSYLMVLDINLLRANKKNQAEMVRES